MISWVLVDTAKDDMRYASYAVLAGGIACMVGLIYVYLVSSRVSTGQFWVGVALYVATLVIGAVLHNAAERNAAARDDFRGFEVLPHDDDEK